jgi:hypothetical protein
VFAGFVVVVLVRESGDEEAMAGCSASERRSESEE